MHRASLVIRSLLDRCAKAALAIALTGTMAPAHALADGGEHASWMIGSRSTADSGFLSVSATSHASLTLRAVLWDGSVTTSTAYGSKGTSANGSVMGGFLRSVSASMSTGGLTGGVTGVAMENPSNPNDYRTRFKMSLYGQVALAYDVRYWVHGYYQPGAAGSAASNGAWVSHNNAAIDGIGWYLIPRSYTHAIQARFQQPDGSWSGYVQQRSGTYAYLATVPAWVRPADKTYKAASLSAYAASYAAKTSSVDVYRQAYKASFDARGGSDCSASERVLLCGAKLGELPEPTRSGFQFEGWYDDPIAGSRITAEATMPTENTTYYAHWSYGISYSPNAGEGFMSDERALTGAGNEHTVRESSFTRPGYEFQCWNTEQDGNGQDYYPGDKLAEPGSLDSDADDGGNDNSANIDAEDSRTVLYAQWKPLQMDFSIPSEIIGAMDATGAVQGMPDEEVAIENNSKTGLLIAGIKARGKNGADLVEQPEEPGEFSLTLRTREARALPVGKFAHDDFTAPGNMLDWSIPAHGKLVFESIEGRAGGIDSISPEGTMVGSVQWLLKPHVVTISYPLADIPEQNVNAGLAYRLPTPPSRGDGKTFLGWSTEPDGAGTTYRSGAQAAFDANTALYALWS